MPRVSAKRSCFCLLLASAVILFFIWPEPSTDPLQPVTSPVVQQAGEWIEVTEETVGTPKEEELPREKPWFMSEGTLMPTHSPIGVKSGLWPAQAPPGHDRIVEQLMFRPPRSFQDDGEVKERSQSLKTILLFNGLNAWYKLKPGRSAFSNCPVDTCKVTASKSESRRADAILYKDHFVHPGHPKTKNQVWIIYHLECPYHTQHVKYNDVFNWTSTYRRDSDIVAPYEKFVYYDSRVRTVSKPVRNYAANKTKLVAWFVSNCGARNGRLQYAHELQKYISVDIFGACGSKKCPRSNEKKCFEMLNNEYKFYLAFENSNCKDYITEKFFRTGLGHDILPIVMGARPDDYKASAPEHSYIHVDEFDSPRSLAEYLLLLDKDDDAYNAYFRWKGLGEFINTFYFCRLCAMLHDDIPMKSYRDINEWWRGPGICTTGSWRRTGQGWQGMARPNF
uniref:Fucosyltransferase n=1 Tax=Lygus hesperus TaxID=30085 RepID=A0A146LJH0_LYGHE